MGGYNINTGGKVKVFNDPGQTHEVIWKERPEPNWAKKERELMARGRTYFGVSSREAALQRILWDQVAGKVDAK